MMEDKSRQSPDTHVAWCRSSNITRRLGVAFPCVLHIIAIAANYLINAAARRSRAGLIDSRDQHSPIYWPITGAFRPARLPASAMTNAGCRAASVGPAGRTSSLSCSWDCRAISGVYLILEFSAAAVYWLAGPTTRSTVLHVSNDCICSLPKKLLRRSVVHNQTHKANRKN